MLGGHSEAIRNAARIGSLAQAHHSCARYHETRITFEVGPQKESEGPRHLHVLRTTACLTLWLTLGAAVQVARNNRKGGWPLLNLTRGGGWNSNNVLWRWTLSGPCVSSGTILTSDNGSGAGCGLRGGAKSAINRGDMHNSSSQ